ncbi:MAG: NAD(P)/FAD-dependent oxidoreductase [Propionibacteriaceae bacterium]|nr:NAD(P)/FAD-dependent oxidoreductase [Propionibacteriaceae bacterium]
MSESDPRTGSGGTPPLVDAVVVGGGHHGLVAAAMLADAGWEVIVAEASGQVGGAVASRTVTVARDDGPDERWTQDDFSAFHPLAKVSPALERLDLAGHGLRWSTAPTPLAHVASADDPGARIATDAAITAAALDADHPGDGDAWLGLVEQWRRIRRPLMRSLLGSWPPVSDPIALIRTLGLAGLGDFARFLLLPVHRMAAELFGGSQGPNILAGNALHADIPLDAPGSGLFGWMMAMLAQDVGMPAPVGGAGQLAAALRSRAESAGAQIQLNAPVVAVRTSAGRATGVMLADGRSIRARRAVIANTSAPALFTSLLPPEALTERFRRRLARFAWDLPTVKINLRLSAPIPWRADAARGAAVLHLGHDLPSGLRWAGDVESGTLPRRPFALAGQMTTVDATRSPAGTETFWAYAHLARGPYQPEAARSTIAGLDDLLAELAPGVHDLVVDRLDQTPELIEATNANAHRGAVGGGTMQLFQQAVFRPIPGLGGPRTPVERLYLGSAAIHPGGGVHGACGALAARAALADARIPGRARVVTAVQRRLQGG